MIDQYLGAVTLTFRALACVLFAMVIAQQIKAFKTNSEVQRLKKLLLALGIMLVVSNIVPLINNYQRVMNQQTANLNRLSFVSSGVAVFISAVLLYLVYRFKVEE